MDALYIKKNYWIFKESKPKQSFINAKIELGALMGLLPMKNLD